MEKRRFRTCLVMVLVLVFACSCFSSIAFAIEPSDILAYEITEAYFDGEGKLNVTLDNRSSEPDLAVKLLVAAYDDDGILCDFTTFDINGTDILGLDYIKPDNLTVILYIWDGVDKINPLSGAKTVKTAPSSTVAPTSTPTATSTPTVTAVPSATPTIAPTTDPERTLIVDLDKETEVDNKIYNTITEAVAAVKEINPKSESERLYINIKPGIYTEQIYLDEMSYLTFQKEPNIDGIVKWRWHYCTNYWYGDCGPNGRYDALVDWTDPRTWSGYNDSDEQFAVHNIGDNISKVSYYDKNGVAHKDIGVYGNTLGSPQTLAPLDVSGNNDWIECFDIYFQNSTNICVTQAEKDSNMIPATGDSQLPDRRNLPVCEEETEETPVDVSKFDPDRTDYTPGEAAYLVRSRRFNERSHALSANAKHMTIVNCTVRSNQDALYVGGKGHQVYFKDCDLIGGTDYIYGDATCLFENTKLGIAGYSDENAGQVITAASTDASINYGYLFFDCYIYYYRDDYNAGFTLGRPWRQDAQVTFYNTELDGRMNLDPIGWRDMTGGAKEQARFFEYGTVQNGVLVDTSKRVINTKAPFGTVCDQWQILEFNPRKYLNGWDPMNFGEKYLTKVDEAIDGKNIEIPEGTSTEIDLPLAPDGVTFHWQSASTNAVVSEDKLIITRPAYGEKPIETTITLYALDNENGFGDKKDIPVTISATTDKDNVYTAEFRVTQQVKAIRDIIYYVSFYSGDALIKTTSVTIPAFETEASKNIVIPVGTYDVMIESAGSYTITNPTEGKTSISGTKGETISLSVYAQKIVDDTVTFDLDYDAKGQTTMTTYELIEMAKQAGADADSLDISDIITVTYTLDINSKLNSYGFIDLLYGEPNESLAQSGVESRFTLGKLNSGWNQFDMVDKDSGFSGSSNTEHQALNICGKFDYKTQSTVSAEINYRKNTVTVSGTGSGSSGTVSGYTFESFPSESAKGRINLAIYPTDGANINNFEIKQVSVTYKKISTDVNEDPNITFVHLPYNEFTGGRTNTDSVTYSFASSVTPAIRSLFLNEEAPSQIDKKFTSGFINYIGNQDRDDSSDPYVEGISIKEGKYTLFLIGKGNNTEVNGTLTDANQEITLFAKSGSATPIDSTGMITVHKIEFEADQDVVDAKLWLTSTKGTWLPDMYGVIIAANDLLE